MNVFPIVTSDLLSDMLWYSSTNKIGVMKMIQIAGISEERVSYYTDALTQAGVPWCVSLQEEDLTNHSALLLPGGADLDPLRYGAINSGSVKVDPDLDRQQWSLIQKALELNKPILGICRGAQILAVYFGGSMIQDIPSAPGKHLRHAGTEGNWYDATHIVHLRPDSWLAQLYGKEEILTNSAHHQGIVPSPIITVDGRSEDGITEAFHVPGKRVFAIQFHPETMREHFEHYAKFYAHTDLADGQKIFDLLKEWEVQA